MKPMVRPPPRGSPFVLFNGGDWLSFPLRRKGLARRHGRHVACWVVKAFPAGWESLDTYTRPARCNGGLMKPLNLTLGLVAAGVVLAAGSAMAQPQPTTPAPATQDAAADQQLDSSDKDFLENAAQSGHAEVEGSKMAQEKAKNPDVKAFADKMVQDHTKVGQELAALASKKGYTPPEGSSLMQKAKFKTLGLTDDGFDEMYINNIGVSAHEDAVKLFEDASANAKDADVKAFAAKTLPALQEHLAMAKKLQEQVKARE